MEKIATGRNRLINRNKPLIKENRRFILRFWLVVLARFFTSVFRQIFSKDCALMTGLKVALYGFFFTSLEHPGNATLLG